MSIYAISDLHLYLNNQDKNMALFGEKWVDHYKKIEQNWLKKIDKNDLVLIPGDISWGMRLKDIDKDFQFISNLPGKKVILKGNHDYWWGGIKKVKEFLKNNNFLDIFPIQNSSIRYENSVITGFRGWEYSLDMDQADEKRYKRELIRLKLGLESAQKIIKPEDKLILITHYPPFTKEFSETPIWEEIKKHPIDHLIFGHLHGVKNINFYNKKVDKMECHLVSSDLIDFDPIKII